MEQHEQRPRGIREPGVLNILGHSVCPQFHAGFSFLFSEESGSPTWFKCTVGCSCLRPGSSSVFKALCSDTTGPFNSSAPRVQCGVGLPFPFLTWDFLSSERVGSECVLGKWVSPPHASEKVLSAGCDRLSSALVALPLAHTSQDLQVQSRASNLDTHRP